MYKDRTVRHDDFVDDMCVEIEAMGYAVGDTTYHTVIPEDHQKVLRARESRTSWLIRHSTDRFATHRRCESEFFFDGKTYYRGHDNMAIEVAQLKINLEKCQNGARILYAYRDKDGKEVGFWMDDLPYIARVLAPKRPYSVETWDYFKECVAKVAPHLSKAKNGEEKKYGGLIPMGKPGKGSGTPFAVIEKSELDKLPDWRVLVLADRDVAKEKVLVARKKFSKPPVFRAL